jgi:hypothetical protein
MAEHREHSEWARTSALLALIANAHRDAKRTRPFKPGDFDPFAHRGEEKTSDMPALRALFRGMNTTDAQQTEVNNGD